MGSDVLIVLVIVLGIVLIWQGPKNLPKLGSALGRSIKDFRTEVSSDDKTPTPATPTAATPTAATPPAAPPKDEPGA
jgi:sec-independent protein translocase protein TatA